MWINNVYWKMRYVSPDSDQLKRTDGSYTIGVCDNNKKTIYVCDSLLPTLEEKVIVHEITHAFCFEYGISIDLDTEEFLCDFVATYGRDIFVVADVAMMVAELGEKQSEFFDKLRGILTEEEIKAIAVVSAYFGIEANQEKKRALVKAMAEEFYTEVNQEE